MTLLDEDTSVVDGLGEALLVDLGLEAALEELLGGELQDGIEVELVIRQKAVAAHAAEEGGTLEDALGILGVEGQKGTGGLAELGQGVLDAPDLALAAEAVLAAHLQFRIETLSNQQKKGYVVRLWTKNTGRRTNHSHRAPSASRSPICMS